MTHSHTIDHLPLHPAMAKERAPKNSAHRAKPGQLHHTSYFKPGKARATTRQSRANSCAVRPTAPAEQKQSRQLHKTARNRLRESPELKTQRALGQA